MPRAFLSLQVMLFHLAIVRQFYYNVDKNPNEEKDNISTLPTFRKSTLSTVEISSDRGPTPQVLLNQQLKKVKSVNEVDLLFGYCEKDSLNEKISFGEFKAINFDNSIPSFALDFINYVTWFDMCTK